MAREDVSEQISANTVESEKLNDFSNGSAFKNHPLFTNYPNALQKIGYYNDMEFFNPVWSAAKTHTLGIFFFTISNLPPNLRSSLKCLYLFAVAKANVVKKYTPDAILALFIADLITLAADGVTVSYSDSLKGLCLPFWPITWQAMLLEGSRRVFQEHTDSVGRAWRHILREWTIISVMRSNNIKVGCQISPN